jgi:hypothetical protein
MQSGLLDKLVSLITSPPRRLPDGYLSFVSKEIKFLFRKGWDLGLYEKFAITTTPSLSGVCGGGRRAGGQFLITGRDGLTQHDYIRLVLDGVGDLPPEVKGELLVVQSAGKPRPLSKFEAELLALRPLHRAIFGRLRRERWLLTGPPSKEALRRAGFLKGAGELVSGDYQSATDGLSVEVAECILGCILERSASVPENVKAFAMAALRPVLLHDGAEIRLTVGQMMGSYLSFPLLCLQNYLAFRWSLRGTSQGKKGVPVLINGDDIIYQLDNHFDRWVSVLGGVGLIVEKSKTSVNEDWGTLNSTLLVWEGELLSPSWSARFGMLRPAEYPNSLGRSFLDFLRGCSDPSLRFSAGREWFRWHIGELRSSMVSLPSLGFRGLLARRLAQSFSLLDLQEVPVLPSAPLWHEPGLPEDFVVRVPRSALVHEDQVLCSAEVGAMVWARGFVPLDRDKAALRYCLQRSGLFSRPELPEFHSFLGPDAEFSFRCRNLGAPRRRLTPSSAFLAPFPSSLEVIVPCAVVDGLSIGFDEWLPPYESPEDACGGSGAAWGIEIGKGEK